jgi:hypothetical protein
LVHLRPGARVRQVDLPKNLVRLLCEFSVSSVLSVSDRDTDNTDRTEKTITPAGVGSDLELASGLVSDSEKAQAPEYPKVTALESAPDWERDSELVLELERAPGWELVSELAMESDSVQALAEPRDSASPLDSKLRFPLLPVCVVVNGVRAQRCVQARTNIASLHPALTLM